MPWFGAASDPIERRYVLGVNTLLQALTELVISNGRAPGPASNLTRNSLFRLSLPVTVPDPSGFSIARSSVNERFGTRPRLV